MKRSIMLGTPMANAILIGKKTVARCVISARSPPHCPYTTGTHLWLKEDFYAYGYWESRHSITRKRDLWYFIDMTLQSGQSYQFSQPERYAKPLRSNTIPLWWHRPGRLMPRQASRIELEVTDISSEHLHDITDEQAGAEGFYPIQNCVHIYFANHLPSPHSGLSATAVIAFAAYWQSSHKDGSWYENPWVWVISFRKI